MKKFILIFLSGILAACKDPPPPPPPVPEPVAQEIFQAEQAAKITIDYQANENPQIYYFGVQGEKADSAVTGGYYRKILGQTADGRAVVQDFYQDNDQAQTSPSILIQDADVTNFEAKQLDSRTVWYRPDGTIFHIGNYQNGELQGASNYYQNGLLAMRIFGSEAALAAQTTTADGKLVMQVFFENGNTHFAGYKKENGESVVIFFREDDGTPITKGYTPPQSHEQKILGTWDRKGKAVDPAVVKYDVGKNPIRIERVTKKLAEDYEAVFHMPAEHNPLRL